MGCAGANDWNTGVYRDVYELVCLCLLALERLLVVLASVSGWLVVVRDVRELDAALEPLACTDSLLNAVGLPASALNNRAPDNDDEDCDRWLFSALVMAASRESCNSALDPAARKVRG